MVKDHQIRPSGEVRAMMNMNQFTQKTVNALQRAQSLAVEYQHMQVEQEHLKIGRAHV